MESPFNTDGVDISDTYLAQDQAFAAVWADPELDEYNEDNTD